MSWQCPYCETVNQDAVPVCTVCDRIAPVIESFLSLEEIEHAREYAEKLSDINKHESSGEYNKMLECALKAIASYQQNDIAVNKAQLAIKLDIEAKIKKRLLSIIDKSVSEANYLLADTTIKIWKALKFDSEAIKDKKDIVQLKLEEHTLVENVKSNLAEALLIGGFNNALEIIDKSLLKYPENKVFAEIRTKIQNAIDTNNEHAKNKSKPTKRFPTIERVGLTVDTIEPKTEELSSTTKRRFPYVKR